MSAAHETTIFKYLNYRLFLKDAFAAKKKTVRGFSHRSFSRHAGLKSSNYLKLVMDGKRNLSAEAISKFAKGFGLNREETNFFEALVNFGHAQNIDEKNRHYERISQFKKYNDVKELEVHQYEYFSKWYYVAMRELVALKNFREDPEWINRKLKTSLTADEIRSIIKTLIELKLLRYDEHRCLKPTEESVTTTPDINSLAILNFHRQMIKKADEALDGIKTSQRDISALTIGISKRQFEKIKKRIAQFRREIHTIASAHHKEAEVVCQFNMQLFCLSEVPWE